MSKMNRKQILGAITATTLLTTSGLAMANPQGLYSADELMDADVYLQNDDQQVVGEVEDVLLDDNMQVAALVVESDEVLGLDDQQYVVETGKFTLETRQGDDIDNLEYRIHVNMDEAQLKEQPQYTTDWWQDTRKSAAAAWDETKDTAASAWQDTRQATANALTSAGNAISGAANDAQDEMTDETQ
ncbi:PRC-barrel domain-containing protein [Cobetia marina]|uniref:PRC-barrel domain-containing protein n=1 Tax=Halomonadaceae TaxID=28256 RepID=UPI00086674E4|nr:MULTISPECIES: PRC-barrel domain-containing protein [Cobetia]AOM02312.1 hypothetical protein BFX80_14830 [Cobetia marina]MDH2373237.1 PRC-barrel domain-containing protein [Cobetia sp. 3AK]MDO6787124.1 PRC-barrel domain-containing protein [Cobetia marina]